LAVSVPRPPRAALLPYTTLFRSTLREPLHADAVERQIARYDAEDAAKVSRLVRANAGTNAVVDQIVSLYGEIIAENMRRGEPNRSEEHTSELQSRENLVCRLLLE